MLNLKSKELYHIFDDYGMPIVKTDDRSWRDSIGRSFLMWVAYYQDPRIEPGLEACLRWEDNRYILYRHPRVIGEEDYKNDVSRDHWSYFLMYRRLQLNDEYFGYFIEDIKVKFGLRLWVAALQGKPLQTFLYYSFQILGNWLVNGWNKFWRKAANIQKEFSNEDWNTLGYGIITTLSKRTKFFRRFLIPNYPQHNKGWQLYVLPEHSLKKILKKILLKRVYNRGGNSNYLLRILFGDKTVTENEVLSYKHMTGYRWGTNLDESTRRDVKFIPAHLVKDNGYEVDILHFAYLYIKTP